ncbi:Luciferin 4-monooxygenase-like Protein [Tribolium castaneum]|uniref:Luciferin 4-monooxygenase n=1 Tax=Tribolium castaneum TaxID=7070 RepID=D6WTG3_TRICA|nr:PREDICTED: luciferin 4-monooxygenase [Tribolium castaneum]EFA06717.1 Luciferin 4-monooxygenase-like Protein [Tribolium castaneum]|eukprot:XP_967226.1 PREDICTED: luciferin 4-monooxygenase [Tribolium castaneum]
MVQEDDRFVIHGPPPLQPLPRLSLGKLVYDSLLANIKKGDAFVDAASGETISYLDLLKKSCFLAESLLKSGYGRDTIVSISSENNVQFYIPVIACLYIGAVVAPINHNYTEYETTHSLNICKPRIVFCSKAVAQKFVQLKNRLGFTEKIVIIDDDFCDIYGTETLAHFIKTGLRGFAPLCRFPGVDFDPDKQIAFIMCSSGTTGLPKGVMQTHTNLMVRYMHTIDPRYVQKADTFLGILPFFHGFGLVTNFFALVQGEKIVVIKRFEEKLFLKAVQDYKIPSLWLAPPLVVLLAKSPLVDQYDLSCIREVTSGAAPLSKETEELVMKRLKIKGIRQGYGLTEATLGVIMMSVGDIKHGSSGKVATYMKCKIRDPETGKSLGPGKVGELCFKGPMVMPGYYNNEEATRNSFTSDGWLLTGDLGYYDQDEYFYIVDRLKELIKYKGFQVAPAELEAVILSHPKVQDVGVVGLPDESSGELPVAFVVKKPGANLTEKEIIDFVAGKVSSQKRLRGGVIFVPAIPKNPSGKILRRELRKMLSEFKSKL